MKSKLEESFGRQVKLLALPEPTREYRFHPVRRWRIDFAWPEQKLAVELEGGIFSGGRHTRGAGFLADCEKTNTLTLLGWRVLRFATQTVNSGEAINMTMEALGIKK